jgi:hypothetical protein
VDTGRTEGLLFGSGGLGGFKALIAASMLVIMNCGLLTGSEAAEYLYHPHSPLRLGPGFDPIAISDTKSECLDYDGMTP